MSGLVMENPSPPSLGLARSLKGCRLFDCGLGYLPRLAAHLRPLALNGCDYGAAQRREREGLAFSRLLVDL